MVLSAKLQGLSATELVPGDDSLPETQNGQLISHGESLEMFELVIVWLPAMPNTNLGLCISVLPQSNHTHKF